MRFSSIDHNRLLVDFKKKQFESALQKQEIPIGIMTDANVFLPTSIENKAVLESFVLTSASEIKDIELSWANDAVGIHSEKSYGILITADTTSSASGSPILNASGRVVGMVNQRIIPDQYSAGDDVLPILTRGLDLDGIKFINHF